MPGNIKIAERSWRRFAEEGIERRRTWEGFDVLRAEKVENGDGGFLILPAPKFESGGFFVLRTKKIEEPRLIFEEPCFPFSKKSHPPCLMSDFRLNIGAQNPR